MSRTRHFSGIIGTRPCKSCWLRIQSGKCKPLIFVVIIFSAWLTLHFVRATLEYHQQTATENVLEMLIRRNNLPIDGLGDNKGGRHSEQSTQSSTESYTSTETWENPTVKVYRPNSGSRGAHFLNDGSKDTWSSTSASTPSGTKSYRDSYNHDSTGPSSKNDRVVTKPSRPVQSLNEYINTLKQNYDGNINAVSGGTESTSQGTTRGSMFAIQAVNDERKGRPSGNDNPFREDRSDLSITEAPTTANLIGNTASNANKHDNLLKIENEQQFIVKPSAAVNNNIREPEVSTTEQYKEQVTSSYREEITTSYKEQVTYSGNDVTKSNTEEDVNQRSAKEDNLNVVAQVDQTVHSENENVVNKVSLSQEQAVPQPLVSPSEPLTGKYQGVVPILSHLPQQTAVAQPAIAVNPLSSSLVSAQMLQNPNAFQTQNNQPLQKFNSDMFAQQEIQPAKFPQQNVNEFQAGIGETHQIIQGSIPVVNQQNVAAQSAGTQLFYNIGENAQTIPVQGSSSKTISLYQNNPAMLQQGNPTIQQQANPAIQQQAYPTIQQQANPAIQQQANPAIQQQAYPAIQQQANLAIQQQANPAIQQQANLAIQQQANPAIQQQANLAIQQQANPAIQQQAYPAIQQQAYPAIQQQAYPVIQQQVNPAVQRQVNPVIQQQAYPVIQQQTNPAIQQQVNPAMQQQVKPSSQQQVNSAMQQQGSSAMLRQISPVIQQRIDPAIQWQVYPPPAQQQVNTDVQQDIKNGYQVDQNVMARTGVANGVLNNDQGPRL